MDLFVVYAIAIDQNQQLMTWELGTARGLGQKEAHKLCTNQSLHYRSGVSPALSFFCQSFVAAQAASTSLKLTFICQ